MKTLQNFLTNPRLIISSLCATAIAMSFWLGSRYPSLGSKESAGGNMEMDSALGFHALLSFGSSDNVLMQILVNGINWMDNNKRGMIFGILFAAAILTFISLWKQRRAKGRLSGMLLGFGIGAPLGVCVNCATPVSQGMHKSGMRLETTLTALFSSPTFNVIVLSILFSLYPFYLAALKIGFTCLFIFLLLPIIIRWTERFIEDKDVDIDKVADSNDELACEIEPKIHYTWLESVQWFCVNYLKNLWFVIKVSMPWMIFSGFLGAAIITVVPWSDFTAWLSGLNQWQHAIGLFVTSVFGLFLPAPIAFDVILPTSLLDQGLLPAYTGTLLFSLGIFSIYPFIIVGRYISWRLSLIMAACLIMLSMGMGVASGYFGKLHQIKTQVLFDSIVSTKTEFLTTDRQSISLSEIEKFAPSQTEYTDWSGNLPAGIKMKQASYGSVKRSNEQDGFRLRKNTELGFSEAMPGDPATAYQFYFPTGYSRGLAAGDIQNDGWIDVARATSQGAEIYLNDGKGRFYLINLGIPNIEAMHVLAVALVDMNNDLYPDLVFTTLTQGNYILYNDGGQFNASRLVKLPNQAAALYTVSIAFADFDGDGQTEIVLGNHWLDNRYGNAHASSLSGGAEYPMDRARNVILRLNNGQWEYELLPGIPGATLTLLTTDFDNDGDIDLLVGNDFLWPNVAYTNDGNNQFSVIKQSDNIIPISTRSTMSIDSADLDNDLDLDQFWAQVTNTGQESVYSSEGLRLKDKGEICQIYADSTWYEECRSTMLVNKHAAQSRIVSSCKGIETELEYKKCVAAVLLFTSIRTRDRQTCLPLLPESLKSSDYICNDKDQRDKHYRRQIKTENTALRILEKKRFDNVILESKGSSFEHQKEGNGLNLTGWSWNALFADFDNDEWQDVYVVNGFFVGKERESNYFFRNQQGKNFVDETLSSGLESYFSTGSSVYADFDNDGDVDILTSPFFAPMKYFENNAAGQGNQSLSFELVDLLGNSSGLGSKMVIHYDNGKKSQLREIKASGGYQSFNPLIATFGLGQYSAIDAVEIFWSTGETTRIDGPIETGSKYRIYRLEK